MNWHGLLILSATTLPVAVFILAVAWWLARWLFVSRPTGKQGLIAFFGSWGAATLAAPFVSVSPDQYLQTPAAPVIVGATALAMLFALPKVWGGEPRPIVEPEPPAPRFTDTVVPNPPKSGAMEALGKNTRRSLTSWPRAKIAIVAGIVLIAGLAWMSRYEVTPAGAGRGVFILDRWTGQVSACASAKC